MKQIKQYESEIPKYFKPTESNISKSNRKSKHKHQYEECLIQYKFSFVEKMAYRHNYAATVLSVERYVID